MILFPHFDTIISALVIVSGTIDKDERVMSTKYMLWLTGFYISLFLIAFSFITKISWMLTLGVTFFVFSFTFYCANTILQPFRFRPGHDTDFAPIIRWGLLLFMATVIIGHFGLDWPYISTVVISFLVFILLPLPFTLLFQHFRIRRLNQTRIQPQRIFDVVADDPNVVKFRRAMKDVQIYVTDYHRRNQTARCLFHHRYKDTERHLIYDICFEIPVNLNRLTCNSEQSVFQAYAFIPGESGSYVHFFPEGPELPTLIPTYRLDESEYESLLETPDRFPCLQEFPLPIATRNVPVYRIELV